GTILISESGRFPRLGGRQLARRAGRALFPPGPSRSFRPGFAAGARTTAPPTRAGELPALQILCEQRVVLDLTGGDAVRREPHRRVRRPAQRDEEREQREMVTRYVSNQLFGQAPSPSNLGL